MSGGYGNSMVMELTQWSGSISIFRENSLPLHGRGCIVGILRLPLGRAAPSESLRMTKLKTGWATQKNDNDGKQ